MTLSRMVVGNWDYNLNIILESTYNCVIAVDKNGYIVVFNESARTLLRVNDDVIGKYIREVLPGSRLPVILRTGTAELGQKLSVNDRLFLVNLIPIINGGEVVGAVAVFEDLALVQHLVDESTLKSQITYYIEQPESVSGVKLGIENILGKSQVISHLKDNILKIAPGDSSVLLWGEQGTGKELFAHVLHRESPRKHGPFVKARCAGVPDNLLEAELFGVTAGNINGIKMAGQVGKLELANQGTLFFDDIDEMSLAMQAKINRVLQDKTIQRIGEDIVRPIDVRFVAATNYNLEELTKQKLFREDLYYRLNVSSLHIPPLRDRQEDLEPLINYLIERYNMEFNKEVIGLSSEVYEVLRKHSWPGNVRELEKVMERAFEVIEDQIIQVQHLPLYLKKVPASQIQINKKTTLKMIIDETEQNTIIQALQRTKGNKVKAARLLGISRAGLYQKLEKYNLLDE